MLCFAAAALCVTTAASTPASADTITLSTAGSPLGTSLFNQGWYADASPRFAENQNYFTGNLPAPSGEGPSEHRSFFTFNLAPIDLATHRITSASLVLNAELYGGTGDVETLGLFDVSTPAATLSRGSGVNPTIFADLGTGTTYGTFNVSRESMETLLTFALNLSALRDIVNTNDGFFSIGGRLLSASAPTDFIFGNSGSIPASLIVQTESTSPTPEPASVLLLGSGCAAALIRARRRKQPQHS